MQFNNDLPLIRWMHQTGSHIEDIALLVNIQNSRHHSGAAKAWQFSDAVARCDDVSGWNDGTAADMLEYAQNAPL